MQMTSRRLSTGAYPGVLCDSSLGSGIKKDTRKELGYGELGGHQSIVELATVTTPLGRSNFLDMLLQPPAKETDWIACTE